MADNVVPSKTTGEMQATLGLTGLTMNAMALIAPGAFLWLTFFSQSGEGATAPSMWIGIVMATLLCLATAVCYAELAKLYPGTGSSYYFAEQSFLNHDKHWRYARLSKFIVGWASHLYYWIYPGVMVAVTGIFCGYVVGTLWPNAMNATNPGTLFMMVVAVVFTFGVAYIAHRGVTGSTAVSIAINVIQISALLVFSVMAIGYRMNHPPGSVAYQFDSTTGEAYTYEFATTQTTANGQTTDTIVRDANMVPQPKLDAAGKPVPYQISYPTADDKGNFLSHSSGGSVVGIHNVGWMFVQATVAILILVGFESVTAMGGEAQERQAGRAYCGYRLAAGARSVLLLVRIFRGKLLLKQRLHDAECSRLIGTHRRHDGGGGRRTVWPGARPNVHAGRGRHGVPSPDRHYTFVY